MPDDPAARPAQGRGRGVVVLDAPSVLGLRPPAPGWVPGARRLPEALRGHRLVERLAALLRALTASELATGLQLTIFDPDLDPDGRLAGELTATVVAGLAPLAS
jgi:hypothetical protein